MVARPAERRLSGLSDQLSAEATSLPPQPAREGWAKSGGTRRPGAVRHTSLSNTLVLRERMNGRFRSGEQIGKQFEYETTWAGRVAGALKKVPDSPRRMTLLWSPMAQEPLSPRVVRGSAFRPRGNDHSSGSAS